MTKLEAIDERRSRRLYLTEPIDSKVPEHLLEGMKAVQKAPSAANSIVKAHFELATGGRFERGNPAKYVL